MPLRCAAALLIAISLAGCAPKIAQSVSMADNSTNPLFDVATLLRDDWQQLQLSGETRYDIVAIDGHAAVRATGDHSASGLIRFVRTDVDQCPMLHWSWRVDVLQRGANLRDRPTDDVAASLFVMFGDPGFLDAPDPVPTLRYVWSNEHVEVGDIIDSPYLSGVVKSVVVQAGEANLGKWVVESRNVMSDYVAAFGQQPTDDIHAVVLFTDNDQTGEPVTAYYEWAKLVCN